jgi:hypothetical protein
MLTAAEEATVAEAGMEVADGMAAEAVGVMAEEATMDIGAVATIADTGAEDTMAATLVRHIMAVTTIPTIMIPTTITRTMDMALPMGSPLASADTPCTATTGAATDGTGIIGAADVKHGARCRVRTCDPYRVKVVLYH